MASIHSKAQHISGIPLGGLGTGTVEIRPDGLFHEWQMFNLGIWAPSQPEFVKEKEPDLGNEALTFVARIQKENSLPLIRHLATYPVHQNPFSTPWMHSVEGICYEGKFPIAKLTYEDSTLPVCIQSKFVSPLIPHDNKASGTPGFYGVFTITNPGESQVTVSLMGMLKNPLAWSEKERKLSNSSSLYKNTQLISMKTDITGKCPTAGSMCFGVEGGEVSFITGEYWKYCMGYVPMAFTLARPHMVGFHGFRDKGSLPNSTATVPPTLLGEISLEKIDTMDSVSKKSLFDMLNHYAFVRDIVETLEGVSPEMLHTDEGITLILKNVAYHLDTLAGKDRDNQSWGNPSLCSKVTLQPGETKEITFFLGWHFPNHFSPSGALIGHQYENWYEDAASVLKSMIDNKNHWIGTTESFANSVYTTSLPQHWADSWSSQLSTLTKCTWWAKNGDFAVWEGLGCCGFHTTDITYQGSFSLLALFPELQIRQMEMGARYQRDDGRVHHMFTPDMSNVDNQFDRVDMNQQFVLLVCRDFLWTADTQYLNKMWPHVLKAMDNTKLLDSNGDGLPDQETGRNTYDDWHFFGTPSYVASLWLSALIAGQRIALELGHSDKAKEWSDILGKATKSFNNKMWNGEYFSLCVEGDRRDECCMSDQIDGEWFTSLIGLGSSLPKDRIVEALRAIHKYNFDAESGLRNALYPPHKKPFFSTYKNFQATGAWTGIEYVIASMMFEYGLYNEAASIMDAVHRCQVRAGRIWDHMECGGHYYRAMSSWATLLSVTGFKADIPNKALTFAPVDDKKTMFTGPWYGSSAWGIFSCNEASLKVECKGGSVILKSLCCLVDDSTMSVTLNSKHISAETTLGNDKTQIHFENEITLKGGDTLVVLS